MKLFATAFSLLAFCGAALAADATGKWTAEVPGRGGDPQQVTFNLKAEGDKLTGTVTMPFGESEISDGKVDGDNISFVQKLEFNGNSFEILYKGKVAAAEIRFTRERQGGQGRVAEFTAKRKS